MYLVGAPLLVIPFAIYNIIAFLMPGVSWSAPLTHLQLMSGAEWTMSVGDILVTFTVLILIVEVIKFARIGTRSFVDHALALLLLFGMAAEFVWVTQASTNAITSIRKNVAVAAWVTQTNSAVIPNNNSKASA